MHSLSSAFLLFYPWGKQLTKKRVQSGWDLGCTHGRQGQGQETRQDDHCGAAPWQLHHPPDSLKWFFMFTCSCPAPLHRHRLNRIVAWSQANTPPRLLAVSQIRGLISPAFAYVLRGISKGTVREMALLNTDAIWEWQLFKSFYSFTT